MEPTAPPPLGESIQRLAAKHAGMLLKHRERYLRAYCARFNIPLEDFHKYELCTRDEWHESVCTTSIFMRPKPDWAAEDHS